MVLAGGKMQVFQKLDWVARKKIVAKATFAIARGITLKRFQAV